MVLSGLKKYSVNLSAIVTMADDGGSSGILRDEYGVLPPGDIRRALVALSRSDKLMRDLFNHRFKSGGLSGHSFGNLFLSTLAKTTGSFEKAVNRAHEVLDVRGKVVPVTLADIRLFAELENGKIIEGESNIDIPKHNPKLKIKKIFLRPQAKVNPEAVKLIKKADLIVLGPGDLYTSIIPNLLVNGLTGSIKNSKAKKVFVMNIMTKSGETNEFKTSNFISILEKYLGNGILDYVIVNKEKPSPAKLSYYKRKDKADFVEMDLKDKRILASNILSKGKLIRHDEKKLAKMLLNIIC